jgi:phage-related protein
MIAFADTAATKDERRQRAIPAHRLIAKFYRAPDGSEPVAEFINRQTAEVALAIDRQIDRINALDEEHPHLAFPHSSQIEGELRELRCHYGRSLYRILYRRSRQFVVLLHAFAKHGEAVPEGEKQIARQRWDDFRRRLETQPRRPPGPIGKKAPPKRR